MYKDPDPYLELMDPDAGGLKTYSATLPKSIQIQTNRDAGAN